MEDNWCDASAVQTLEGLTLKKKKQWIFDGQIDLLTKKYEMAFEKQLLLDQQIERISEALVTCRKSGVRALRHGIGAFQHRLSAISVWHGIVGTVRVANGEPEGWGDLWTGHRFMTWSIRIRQALADQRKDGHLLFDREPHTLAAAVVFQDNSFFTWLAEVQRAAVVMETLSDAPFGLTPFGPFMVQLSRFATQPNEPVHPDLFKLSGPYQALITNWNDESEFATSIVAACDYHCERTFDDRECFAEFAFYPFTVFPAEILAVLGIRRRLKLSTPLFSHPLMDTPLAAPHLSSKPIDDELLTQVIEIVKAECPQYVDAT